MTPGSSEANSKSRVGGDAEAGAGVAADRTPKRIAARASAANVARFMESVRPFGAPPGRFEVVIRGPLGSMIVSSMRVARRNHIEATSKLVRYPGGLHSARS